MTPFYWHEGATYHPDCTPSTASPALFPATTKRKCGGCGGRLSSKPKGGRQ